MTRRRTKATDETQPPASPGTETKKTREIARGVQAPSQEARRDAARTILSPVVTAAVTLERLRRGALIGPEGAQATPDAQAFCDELSEATSRMHEGSMMRGETMLFAQAHTLDALYSTLALTAKSNLESGHLEAFDRIMRLALRAQSQARATLETLSTMKNPPLLIAKQANIAHGPQQVNNGPPTPEPSRAGESQNEPNRLLEQQHGDRLDTFPSQTASGADKAMATVGEVHGAEVRRR